MDGDTQSKLAPGHNEIKNDICWLKKNCIPWSLINVGLGRQRQKIQVCLDSSPCMNGVKSGGGRMNLADGEELTEREW